MFYAEDLGNQKEKNLSIPNITMITILIYP